MQWEMVGIV